LKCVVSIVYEDNSPFNFEVGRLIWLYLLIKHDLKHLFHPIIVEQESLIVNPLELRVPLIRMMDFEYMPDLNFVRRTTRLRFVYISQKGLIVLRLYGQVFQFNFELAHEVVSIVAL